MQKRVQPSLLILLLILLVFTLSGCIGQKTSQNINVNTAIAANKGLDTKLELSGVLVPTQTVDISSKISGQITALGFQVGNNVKAGDIIMQLDTESLNGQLMQAEANLQAAQASAQSVDNQASLVKINLDAAQKNYNRTKALFASGAVSQSQLDEDQDKLETAQKQYENASGPARNQAQAAVNVAQANVRNLEIQLKNATIKSPIDGIITNQSVNIGQNVSPGTAVISIVNTSTLKMKSTVSQDVLPLLSVGQKMDITISSYPNKKFQGNISCIGPIAVSTGEVFPVEITIKNSNSLMAGLSAHASGIIKTKGIVIPSASVIHNNGASYVYVIKNNIAFKRSIRVGLNNEEKTVILKGLHSGDRVAVSNLSALSNKIAVNVYK
ncbi:MAG: efflux RND transporter periplasmic adaptor subunit [Syntrophomonas sp.]